MFVCLLSYPQLTATVEGHGGNPIGKALVNNKVSNNAVILGDTCIFNVLLQNVVYALGTGNT